MGRRIDPRKFEQMRREERTAQAPPPDQARVPPQYPPTEIHPNRPGGAVIQGAASALNGLSSGMLTGCAFPFGCAIGCVVLCLLITLGPCVMCTNMASDSSRDKPRSKIQHIPPIHYRPVPAQRHLPKNSSNSVRTLRASLSGSETSPLMVMGAVILTVVGAGRSNSLVGRMKVPKPPPFIASAASPPP